MIASNNISIILQGSIIKTETLKCLKSIRKYLPNAEIILSTWEGAEVEELEGLFDILVLNKDPEAVLMTEFKMTYNNLNRQLLSTQEGLKRATRKYAMKLRSDLILTSNKFLKYFDEFPRRSENYQLFTHKVLVPAIFSRYSLKVSKNQAAFNVPFHPSDWWMFGLREDLNKYYLDTPLAPEPYFTKYFELEENRGLISPFNDIKTKFTPEQYLCYEVFHRNFSDIYMKDVTDYSDELMEKSRECFVNNFIVLEFEQSGIYLKKYPFSKNEKFSGEQYIGLYNFHRYEEEYKKYCDSDYKITVHSPLFDNENLGCALLRVYKHVENFTCIKTPILQRLEQLFIGIPISIISYLVVVIKEKYGAKIK